MVRMILEMIYIAQRHFWRGPDRALRLVSRSLSVIGLIFTCFYLFAAGIQFDKILAVVSPGVDAFSFFRIHALTFFLLLLIFRLLLQHGTGIDLKPLLLLPITRERIVLYRMASDLINLHTLVPLAIGFPIVFSFLPGNAGPLAWGSLALNLTICSLTVSWLVPAGHLAFQRQRKAVVGLMLIAGGAVVVDFVRGNLMLESISSALFDPRPAHSWLRIAPPGHFLFLAAVFYRRMLLSKLYLGETSLSDPSRSRYRIKGFVLERLAEKSLVWNYFQCEWRLIWRQERTRQGILFSALMGLACALLMTVGQNLEEELTVIPILLGFSLGPNFYAAGLFGWEGRHFAGIRAWPQHPLAYLRAKLTLLRILCAVMSLPPMLYFSYTGLGASAFILFISFFSVVPSLFVFAGLFNRKMLDASGGIWLNYQGIFYFKVAGFMLLLWIALQVGLRAALPMRGFEAANLVLSAASWLGSRKFEEFLGRRFSHVQHAMYASFFEIA